MGSQVIMAVPSEPDRFEGPCPCAIITDRPAIGHLLTAARALGGGRWQLLLVLAGVAAWLYSPSAARWRYTDARLTPSALAIAVGLSPRSRRALAAASLSASITVGRPPLRP
jgi:hypothetical protein